MSGNPRDMDGFMPLLSTTDIKKKLSVGDLVLNYLGDPDKSIECQDIGLFIDNVIPWLTNGNPKVSKLIFRIPIWVKSKALWVSLIIRNLCGSARDVGEGKSNKKLRYWAVMSQPDEKAPRERLPRSFKIGLYAYV
ncbi:CLIP-associating protein 1 isoform X9 [Vespula squamosa]|uniref:CLIP-associating protein 1 isoform X9 n=1 Tax=Vespula squamosa TaxID=30214 RepID=A0ABD1ZZA1_VESSQ